jgi:hypothetical protein
VSKKGPKKEPRISLSSFFICRNPNKVREFLALDHVVNWKTKKTSQLGSPCSEREI